MMRVQILHFLYDTRKSDYFYPLEQDLIFWLLSYIKHEHLKFDDQAYKVTRLPFKFALRVLNQGYIKPTLLLLLSRRPIIISVYKLGIYKKSYK